jgi:uncharacterized membrane protein affecting hemolysin expression
LLACGSILIYDQLASRVDMRADLSALADILGSNSTAALTFGDSQAAQEVLLGLTTKKNITRAVIYSADGTILAESGHISALDSLEARGGSEGSWFTRDRLVALRKAVNSAFRST